MMHILWILGEFDYLHFFVYIYEGIMQYYIYYLEVHTIFDYNYVFYKFSTYELF